MTEAIGRSVLEEVAQLLLVVSLLNDQLLIAISEARKLGNAVLRRPT